MHAHCNSPELEMLTSLPNGLHTPDYSDPEPGVSDDICILGLDGDSNTFVVPEKKLDREGDTNHNVSILVPDTPSSSDFTAPSAINDLPYLFTMEGLVVPRTQEAAITPEMHRTLNVQRKIIPVKTPEYGEVVVRVAWTGMCRSDVCFSLGPEPGYPTHDHIAGHEGIGHVVQSYNPSHIGKAVAMRYLTQSCGSCYLCLCGIPENCPTQVNFPKHHNGTYQQYVTAPWDCMMPLPSWVFDKNSAIHPAAVTAALCSGSTALHALKVANPQPSSVVVVVGIMGGIGHLVGLIAKQIYNCAVVGIDWEAKRGSFSGNAHTVYDIFVPMPEGDVKDVQQLFQRELQQACYELRGFSLMADACVVAGSSSYGVENVPSYVRDGASIIFVGAPRGGDLFSISLQTLVERQLRLQGAMMGGRDEAYQMLHYIHTRQVVPFITEVSLDEVGDSMSSFLKDRSMGKTVCRVNGPLP